MRAEHGIATNSIARRGQGEDFVPFHFPLQGVGTAPLPVTLRSRRSLQAVLLTICTLSRQMARTTSTGEVFLSLLVFFIAEEFVPIPLFFGKKVSEVCILSLREEEKYATIRTDRSV